MQVIDYTGGVLMLLIDGITNMCITLDANDQRLCIKERCRCMIEESVFDLDLLPTVASPFPFSSQNQSSGGSAEVRPLHLKSLLSSIGCFGWWSLQKDLRYHREGRLLGFSLVLSVVWHHWFECVHDADFRAQIRSHRRRMSHSLINTNVNHWVRNVKAQYNL